MRYLGVLLAVVWMMMGAVLPLQDVHAQGLLPTTEIAHPQGSVTSCDDLRGLRTSLGPSLHGYYLVTKIRCGLMQVGDIPFYVKGILEFLLRLAATISVIMIMVGGYQYAIGAITDNKEQGKKTITSAIIGLIVALVAWIVINAIQVLVTFTTGTTL